MAHTHKYEHRVINGVPFVQASAYSRGVSTINFSFNKKKHTNELTYSGYTYLADKGLLPDSIVDQKINEKKSNYRSEYETIIGTNEVEDLDYGKMSQFYAKISFDQAVTTNKEHPIVGCMFNESRRGLKTGEFTYSDLFETHPFVNGLYIMSVTEQDINNEKKYSYGYINPEARIGNSTSRRWDILVFDYNGFHRLHLCLFDKIIKPSSVSFTVLGFTTCVINKICFGSNFILPSIIAFFVRR